MLKPAIANQVREQEGDGDKKESGCIVEPLAKVPMRSEFFACGGEK
jgi:hypothetical protein